MAETGSHKSASELRLEQLQKWRESRGRQHKPGREPLTSGYMKTNTKANLPPFGGSSAKKLSTKKRKQKENAAEEENHSQLEKLEQWRSEKKKKQERESASKRPPWRPCSASKTNLFSQPMARCCNHSHMGAGPRSRKKLAMDGEVMAGNIQNQDEHRDSHMGDDQGNQELQQNLENIENNAQLLPQIDNNDENNQDVLLHIENIVDNQDLQPHLNNMEEDNRENPELFPMAENLQVNPEKDTIEDNLDHPEPLPNAEAIMDNSDTQEINSHPEEMEDGHHTVEEVAEEEEEQEGVAQAVPMATVGDIRQDIELAALEASTEHEEEANAEINIPSAEGNLTETLTIQPLHSSVMDISDEEENGEHEGTVDIAVRPNINITDDEETALNMENSSDSQEEQKGATAAVPKKLSMRQKLEQWLVEKGKTPSRFRSILTFKTPAPGSARRKFSRRIRSAAAPFWPGLEDAGKEEEDDGKDAVTLELEAMFQECIAAIDEGYPADNISSILDSVFSSIPQCVQHSQYWLCRARLAQAQRDDHHVLSMFEMAVAAHAEPFEDIKNALTDFVLRKEAELSQQAPEDDGIDHVRPAALFKTPKRRSVFNRLDQGAAFDSSMKMYSVTPLFRRAHKVLRKTAPPPVATVAPMVVTPVRRSARIHRASTLHPPALRDHDPCVPSLADVSEEEFVLRSNRALVRDSPNMADRDED